MLQQNFIVTQGRCRSVYFPLSLSLCTACAAVLVSCGHDITGQHSSPIGHLATLPGNSSERPACVCVYVCVSVYVIIKLKT